MKNLIAKLILCSLIGVSIPQAAVAQGANPFIGQIMWVPYDFCPRGWADTNGQILSISQNTALFSLLGTTYGGNGQTTFALPDLRGRAPIHEGQGPGLTNRTLGQVGGQESVTLIPSQMPAHNHGVVVSKKPAAKDQPEGNFLAGAGTYRAAPTDSSLLNGSSLTVAGGNQPHENMPPYLTIRGCIALEGIFPSRS